MLPTTAEVTATGWWTGQCVMKDQPDERLTPMVMSLDVANNQYTTPPMNDE